MTFIALKIFLIILGSCILKYTILNDIGLLLVIGIISGIGCFYIVFKIDDLIDETH